MNQDFLTQTPDKPLFEEVLWSKPENKRFAGKILIIGGNKYGFSAPANAYSAADKAGAGTIRVILPDSIKKTAEALLDFGEFAPTTPSGSFGVASLDTWLDNALWADSVLLAGDLGKNSETGVLVEKFTQKFSGTLVVTQDAADYYIQLTNKETSHIGKTLVVSFAQLQKLATNLGLITPLTSDMTIPQIVTSLKKLNQDCRMNIVVKFHTNVLVSAEERVTLHKLTADKDNWRTETAASASVWLAQNPNQPFKALTTSLI